MAKVHRLAVVNSHPVQYFAPLYRRIEETSDIDIFVYYCSKQGLQSGFIDPGFGKEVVWDVPLLEGYRYAFLPNLGGDRGVGGFLSLINLSIVLELWRKKYDAVLIHGHNFVTNLLTLLAAKLSGTKVFMRGDTHLLLKRSALKRALRKPVMTFLYKFCDACLYIGARNRQFYEFHGVPPQKLFAVPYAVDNDAFSVATDLARRERNAVRARLCLAPDHVVILYASKLTAQKRPYDLLRAFSDLRRRSAQVTLVFVGDGEERRSLEMECVALGCKSNVLFAGFVNQTKLPEYYAAADFFVLPSEHESWGLVINEVMCCGLPVVASSEIGATADLVIDGQTGFTYRAGDVGALTDALTKLTFDETLRGELSKNCRARMTRWSLEDAVFGIRLALRGS